MIATRTEDTPRTAARVRPALRYAGIVAASVGSILVLLQVGSWTMGEGSATDVSGQQHTVPDTSVIPLPALPIILLVCLGAGWICQRLSQPRVIGEICAGILLGPSVLGMAWPSGQHWLFSERLTAPLMLLAQLALVCFMFLVGYEFELGGLRGRGHTVLIISYVGVAVPLVSGILLALVMYRPYAPQGTGFPAFALFLAVSMSITALPVLARIVAERKLDRTPLGTTALASAMIGDVAAWCLLAVVVATAAHTSLATVGLTLALTATFCALLWLLVRPALYRLMRNGRINRIPDAALLSILFCSIMLFALATDRIGVHAIFGAFLLGVVTPRGSSHITRAAGRLRAINEILLPLFFVYSGLRTDIGLLAASWHEWAWCVLIIVVAIIAKWGSTTAAAWATGVTWPDALSLGALMNCRGLTELIVLNVGLDLGIISRTVFTMLVIMALISTIITSPAISAITRLTRAVASAQVTGHN